MLASLIGLFNGFRMRRLPDIEPSAPTRGDGLRLSDRSRRQGPLGSSSVAQTRRDPGPCSPRIGHRRDPANVPGPMARLGAVGHCSWRLVPFGVDRGRAPVSQLDDRLSSDTRNASCASGSPRTQAGTVNVESPTQPKALVGYIDDTPARARDKCRYVAVEAFVNGAALRRGSRSTCPQGRAPRRRFASLGFGALPTDGAKPMEGRAPSPPCAAADSPICR